MSDVKGISHDTASQLIQITPSELEKLVANGYIRRHDKNSYSVPILVQDYIEYLKDRSQSGKMTQAEVAVHLDVSDRTVRELQLKLNLPENYTLPEIRVAYIRHLREQAAGRQSESGELDLVQERALLAREQRISQELKNAETRKEYARVELLAEILASASQAVADELNSLPASLKKVDNELSEKTITAIDDACRRARANWLASTLTLDIKEPTEEEITADLFIEENEVENGNTD